MRKYRSCSNSKCPSKKDNNGGFTKAVFKTDSKTAIYCPHCRKKLPDYIPEIDPNADPNTPVPVPIIENKKSIKIVLNNLDAKIKQKIGGINMKNINWKIISLAVLAFLILVIGVTFSKVLIGLGIWGIVFLIGIACIFLAILILLNRQINPEEEHQQAQNWLTGIGICAIILALFYGIIVPNYNHKVIGQRPSPTATIQTGVFSLGVPADPKDVDPTVWKQPLKGAVMIDGNGIVYYTQSGKNGTKLLKGQIPSGQTLVLDSYALSKKVNDKVESYSGGNILVVTGPLNLDENPISYTDGAAQMIGTTELQNFLDTNVWVKFSRGDRLKDDSAWSYKKWALNHIWLPEGYTFKELGLTEKTDTFPSK